MRQFVGRDAICAAMIEALIAPEPVWVAQLVHGPGGVGKSWLLRRYATLAADHGARVLSIDARNVDASTGAFLAAVDAAARAAGIDDLAADGRRCLILIDTCELLTPLDGWLREQWLPGLPPNVMLVLASRNAPAPEWRAHPEWNGLIRPLALRNLEPDQSRAYLQKRGVPEPHHEGALNFTRGHPLALSLLADVVAQRANIAALNIEDVPDVIKALLDNFVQKVPGPAHRAALEACALVRVLNEGLLARMLRTADAHELFEWLRNLSFVDAGRHGLYPHDLARDVIAAEVRWRNPDWFAELHKRARAYYTTRINDTGGHDQQRAIYDFTFLHRYNSVVRQFLDWQENGNVRAEPATPADSGAILGAIRRTEGDAAADIAAHWLRRFPGTVFALRDAARLAGYLIRVPLHELEPGDLEADPLVARAMKALNSSSALRAGEQAAMFRFWGSLHEAPAPGFNHQAVSTVQSLIFVMAVQYYLATPRLACTFFCCADPDFWAALFAYADLERWPELDHSALGRPHGVYVHDWRVRPPGAWLDLLAEREMSVTPPTAPSFRAQTQLIALSEGVFGEALREAVKYMARAGGLRGNPLLGSRMVLDAAGGQAANDAARAEALKQLILTAAAGLEANAKDVKLYRAFYHTYVKPAASQEAAAELIDVPFSSYRRHLQTAIERIQDQLWLKELGE